MARPLKTPRTISRKDRQFEELLRRAFEFLNRSQPSKALATDKKRRGKVA
jgi:hypothetical protein